MMTTRRWLLIPLLAMLALLLATAVAGAAPAPQAGPPDFVQGEVLVKFKPGTPGALIAEVHRQSGAQVKEVVPGIDVQVLRVPAGQELDRVAAYSRNPNVQFAEVNGFYYAVWNSEGEPNDPRYKDQWQYPKIQAPQAWALQKGSSDVRVAILDTGIDQSHEEFQGGKIANNVNYTDSGTVDDLYGHGTHVAGSVAATTNNSIGVAGTAPNAGLDNVKVLNDSGSGAWSWIANGIMWAANNGSKVINLSLGGTSSSSTLENAVNYAWNKGVVVVAAAGNNGNTSLFYPAAYANAIAVAATDSNDNKASFSNYGTWVDVAAPGASILSTAPDHKNSIWRGPAGPKYGTISGTSMASPHVAGLAALIFSAGATGNSQVRQLIQDKAEKISGTGTLWKDGRINAFKSLSAVPGIGGPTNQVPVANAQSVTTAEDIAKLITLSGSDADSASLTFSVVSVPGNGTLSAIGSPTCVASGGGTNCTAPVTYTPNLNFNGSDSFTFKVNDGQSDSDIATVDISVTAVNDAPEVTISSPTNEATYASGATITFSGGASDVEDDNTTLTSSLAWTSSIDGPIGSGGSFSKVLTDGAHTITASVTDSGGLTGSASVTITVEAATGPPPPPDEGAVTAVVSYHTEGGRGGLAHLVVTVSLVDSGDNAVAVGGVSIAIDVFHAIDELHDKSLYRSVSGTTGSNGSVSFKFTNAPSGHYTTDVTSVSGSGISWPDGDEEDPGFTK